MPYCENCGAEMKEDAKFCPSCGATMGKVKEKEWRAPRQECFGWERGGEIWGTVAFGVFLIGLAIIWYYDVWWPGIILLIGMMVIVGGFISYITRGRSRSSSTSRR